ncbi:hypothetical protein C7M84_012745 [Penaeus vannamei]|uniref:ERAP1-like C-terminal domain-containing protein n=1 Tax=Penaeus vannamei TaxID=6689 RepID=A0A3R7MT12_PENVA|nr:hypothetical protein C7M84_012745 [Penaeus vannamei]
MGLPETQNCTLGFDAIADDHLSHCCLALDLRSFVPPSLRCFEEQPFSTVERSNAAPRDLPFHLAKDYIARDSSQTGLDYRRSTNDDHNWGLPIQQLRDDHKVIHVVNRAQIIDDAMNLARNGQLSYTTALDVLAYLKKERDLLPWTSGISNVGYVMAHAARHCSPCAEEAGCGHDSTTCISPSPLLLLPFPRPPPSSLVLPFSLPLWSSPSPLLLSPFPAPLPSLVSPSPLFLSPSLSLSFSRPSFPPPSLDLPFLSPSLRYILDLLAPAPESHWSCDMASQDSMAELTLFACRLGRHESLRLFRRWMRHPENRTSLSPNHWSEVLCTGVSAGGEKEWELVWNEYLNSNTTQERTSFLTALACSENATILSRVKWTTYMAKNTLQAFLQDRNTDLTEVARTAEQVLERTKNNVMWMEANVPEIVKFLEDHGYASPEAL